MSAADHAPFAPSSMSMLMACAGSFRMRKLYPEPDDSPHAMEGVAAHHVCAEALKGRWMAVGELCPNGIAVTEEMIEGAEMYAQAVEPYAESAWIEQPVSCASLHSDCFGTPDFMQITANRIVVADYKFGHRHVEVFENWQLITYAAANASADPSTEVILIVVQPRSYHRDGPVRTWRTTVMDLRKYWRDIAHRITEAQSESAQCTPSPACLDCSARHACMAAQESALAAMDVATSSIPLELTEEALSLELRMTRRLRAILDARIDGLEEQAFSLLRGGKAVPGFTLQAGSGRERWSKPIDEIVALGLAMGIDLAKPGAITPKQAVKAGMPIEVVKAYAETPVGEVKLAESDERQLRKVFSA